MRNFVVLAAVTLLAACGGGAKNVRSGGAADETPQWVAQGTGGFGLESGKKLQGVGSAKEADPKARRKAADAAAAQQVQSAVDNLAATLTRMSESTKVNVGNDIGAIARRAAAAVPHARDHWVTSDGSEVALDQVDLATLKQALQSVDGDDGLKREMSNNADRAFDQVKQ